MDDDIKLQKINLGKFSIICGLASFILGPFGFVPGIIMGHKSRPRKNKLAYFGLWINYTSLILFIVLYIRFAEIIKMSEFK